MLGDLFTMLCARETYSIGEVVDLGGVLVQYISAFSTGSFAV